MEIVITSSTSELASLGADVVQATLARKPDAVIGLATGSSPLPVYAELGRRVAAGTMSFARVKAFMLDEYLGLPLDHPQRYRTEIDEKFTYVVDIDPANVHGPDGLTADVPGTCTAYEAAIKNAGGVDLQIVGVGTDGHIGFNEPGSSLASRTRIKTLNEQTRRDNARFFGGDLSAVPIHCLTQGIGTIMDARHILLVALGEAKAEAIHQVLEGAVTSRWPASILQMHPHVTVLVDEPAASLLQLQHYARDTFANKPSWQGF